MQNVCTISTLTRNDFSSVFAVFSEHRDGAAATAARGVTVDDASLVRNMQLEVQKRLHEQLEVQSLFRAASIDL